MTIVNHAETVQASKANFLFLNPGIDERDDELRFCQTFEDTCGCWSIPLTCTEAELTFPTFAFGTHCVLHLIDGIKHWSLCEYANGTYNISPDDCIDSNSVQRVIAIKRDSL